MKMIDNIVVIEIHPEKIINGSTFYAFEYFMALNKITPKTSRLVIRIPEYFEETKKLIIESFQEKYNCNIHIQFCKRKTDVLKLLVYAKCVLFLDIFSFKKYKDISIQKFVYSNEFYEEDYNKLSDNVKNTTKFYGWYDYQYHNIGCTTKLKINFDIFKELPLMRPNDYTYLHLTDPNIDSYNISLIKNRLKLTDILFKKPNEKIDKLFSKISTIYYIQNSDIIDKNNRTLLEAQYYGLNVFYYDFYSTSITNSNINRLKSREYNDFTLSETDILLRDITEYGKRKHTF